MSSSMVNFGIIQYNTKHLLNKSKFICTNNGIHMRSFTSFNTLNKLNKLNNLSNLNTNFVDKLDKMQGEVVEDYEENLFNRNDYEIINNDQEDPVGQFSRIHPRSKLSNQKEKVLEFPNVLNKCIEKQISYYNYKVLKKFIWLRNQQKRASELSGFSNKGFSRTIEEVDIQILSDFIYDYSSIHSILYETRNRMGYDDWKPKNILSVGFGPSTEFIALSNVFSDLFEYDSNGNKIPWQPNSQVSVIFGHWAMKKRAKVFLNALAEYKQSLYAKNLSNDINNAHTSDEIDDEFHYDSINEERKEVNNDTHNDTHNETDLKYMGDDTVESSLKTFTNVQFRKQLPPFGSKEKYDLIIANHQIFNIDYLPYNTLKLKSKIDHLLSLLSKDGVIIFVEDGGKNSFEALAKVRSHIVKKSWKNDNDNDNDNDNENENVNEINNKSLDLNSNSKPFQKWDEKYVPEETFNPSNNISDKKKIKETEETEWIDIKDIYKSKLEEEERKKQEEIIMKKPVRSLNLRILAPCPHHGRCPLQTYLIKDSGIAGNTSCSFNKRILRPKFSRELLFGKMKLLIPPKELKQLKTHVIGVLKNEFNHSKVTKPNSEIISKFSYLIIQSVSDENLSKIPLIDNEQNLKTEELVKLFKKERLINRLDSNKERQELENVNIKNPPSGPSHTWPRVIISNGQKRDSHVHINVCTGPQNLEKWVVNKSFSKMAYHDARKVKLGDIWGLGAKAKVLIRRGMSRSEIQRIAATRVKKNKNNNDNNNDNNNNLNINNSSNNDNNDAKTPSSDRRDRKLKKRDRDRSGYKVKKYKVDDNYYADTNKMTPKSAIKE